MSQENRGTRVVWSLRRHDPDLVELMRRLGGGCERTGHLRHGRGYLRSRRSAGMSSAFRGRQDFEGMATIRAFFEDWRNSFEEWEIEFDEMLDIGDGVRVYARHQAGRPVGHRRADSASSGSGHGSRA